MPITAFWVELRLALYVFIVSLLIGYLSGYWALSISIGLLGFIVWHLRQMMYLRRWLEAGASINDVPNLYGSAYSIITNICDTKKLNQQEQNNLQNLLARFNATTAVMPDAMFIVDSEQVIEWANPATKRLLGVDPDRDIGQRIDNIVRDPEITKYVKASDYAQPLEFSSSSSTENDLLLRVMSYDDGKKLFIVHDHSDLLRLQNVRRAFVSNASHEMRTPLTVIIGYLETLTLNEEMSATIRRGVEGALEQAQRLKQLIEDLLSLSRLESLPLSKSSMEAVDVTMLVRESIELVKSSDFYKQHIFNTEFDENIQISGDYRELQSAVQNILDNAVKYSPENTPITISWKQLNAGSAVLSVQDGGEGIDAAHLPRLTERFYRVDDGRSRDKGGTGLGLSIVKHIMERHGGELKITSERGKGTKVQLFFPDLGSKFSPQTATG